MEEMKYIRKHLVCKRQARKNFLNPVGTNQPICPKCKMLVLLKENGNTDFYHCFFCNRDLESTICEFRKIYQKDIDMLVQLLKKEPLCERSKKN